MILREGSLGSKGPEKGRSCPFRAWKEHARSGDAVKEGYAEAIAKRRESVLDGLVSGGQLWTAKDGRFGFIRAAFPAGAREGPVFWDDCAIPDP